jgi:hypothetical protein
MGSKRVHAKEVIAVALLLFGWIFAGIGELVGIGLLWSSKTWSKSDKIVGTFIPVAVAGVFLQLDLGSSVRSCSSRAPCSNLGPSVVDILLIVLLFATVIVAISIAIRLIRRVFQQPA